MHIIRQRWTLQYRLSLPAIDPCLYYLLFFFFLLPKPDFMQTSTHFVSEFFKIIKSLTDFNPSLKTYLFMK